MGSTRVKRILKLAFNFLLVYFLSSFITLTLAAEAETVEETSTKSSLKLSEILRNISQSASSPPPEISTVAPRFPIIKRNARLRRVRVLNRRANRTNSSTPVEPDRDAATATANAAIADNKSKRESSREPKALQAAKKISGIVDGGKKNPQDLIRNALLNHTLEHGGEQDLDKLVFSNLPNGSRLVLRTVRIIRTDEDGNPMDDSEKAQPTYWDVTLANATDLHDDDEEDDAEDSTESDESEEEEGKVNNEKKGKEVETVVVAGREIALPPVALKSTTDQVVEGDKKVAKIVRSGPRKKSDLESSGSHSAANYHHLNNYGSTGREKEIGKTNFHGNTHGNSHKHTYTVSDGKDVKPYHGTEKGATDYVNDHGKANNDEGERFKSTKRKNKGRKVTGFKRVYHKEEYQRTEHFYDDEEAKKIAESFGLSEAKDASNHGTKDDKRKYQGVRTDYLDGKKHENEYGTHNGYNKGQQTEYKDTQKHTHHSDYGKSQSQSHGSSPHHNNHHGYDYQQNDHSNHHPQQHVEYHPNHNYHASYSSPKKSASQVPTALLEQLGGARSLASIVSAPMAHSFTVTEFAPLVAQSVSTSDPNKMSVTVHSLPETSFDVGNFTSPPDNLNNDHPTYDHDHHHHDDEDDSGVYKERRKPYRKRPRQRKMYFSPKHRPVKEEEEIIENTNDQLLDSLKSPPKQHPVSYQVSSVSDIINSPDNINQNGLVAGENDTKYTPYAPNFAPPPPSTVSTYVVIPQHEYNNRGNAGRHPKTPYLQPWPPRRQKRPRPSASYPPPPHQMHQLLSPQASGYPPRARNQMHLAGIPLRHASAFHRLGNRHHRYSTLKHHPKLQGPYELSTRKSDSVENDNENRTSLYSPFDNDSAHYFNHNQRYAKHHLTSTINPLGSDDNNGNGKNNGVRNTLIDSVPGVYSTVIKVLPATMLNLNESSINGLDQHHLGTNNAGQSSSVTQRPLTQADTISITTAYPQHYHRHHHQPLASQQQELRPFIPKKRWLTFSFNLGNPDYKLGNEFGPSQHPFGHNSKKASYLMQGIKNGILKPLGRGAHALLTAPTSQQNYQRPRTPLHHSHGQHIMMRRPLMHKRPFAQRQHPIFAHNVASYDNFGVPAQTPGAQREMLSSMSKDNMQSVRALSSTSPTSVSLPVLKSKKPKFFYNYKSNEVENKTTTEAGAQQEQDAERRGDPNTSVIHIPMLKVAQTATVPTAVSSTTALAIKEANNNNARKIVKQPQPTQPPPFINGIMDSVADFFGRMG